MYILSITVRETTEDREMTNQIAELMTKYDEYKAKWIETFGEFDEAAFRAWFTKQVLGN